MYCRLKLSDFGRYLYKDGENNERELSLWAKDKRIPTTARVQGSLQVDYLFVWMLGNTTKFFTVMDYQSIILCKTFELFPPLFYYPCRWPGQFWNSDGSKNSVQFQRKLPSGADLRESKRKMNNLVKKIQFWFNLNIKNKQANEVKIFRGK